MAVKNREPRTISARLWPTDMDTLYSIREKMSQAADSRPVSIAEVISRLLETYRDLRDIGIIDEEGCYVNDCPKDQEL
jgi:hypothetical protein